MRRFAMSLALLVGIACLPGQLLAQSSEPVLQPVPGFPVREVLLQSPPSTLRNVMAEVNLVGLQLSAPEGPADVGNLRIITGQDIDKTAQQVCVRITTRDGRYSARGRFSRNPTPSQTARLAINSAYDRQLRSYSASDLAVVAQSAANCDQARDGTYYVAMIGERSGAELIVRLDGPVKRVQVQLGQGRDPVSDIAPCKPTEGAVQIGFVQECRIALPSVVSAGLYQLAIGETASNGKIEIRRVQLRLGRG